MKTDTSLEGIANAAPSGTEKIEVTEEMLDIASTIVDENYLGDGRYMIDGDVIASLYRAMRRLEK